MVLDKTTILQYAIIVMSKSKRIKKLSAADVDVKSKSGGVSVQSISRVEYKIPFASSVGRTVVLDEIEYSADLLEIEIKCDDKLVCRIRATTARGPVVVELDESNTKWHIDLEVLYKEAENN